MTPLVNELVLECKGIVENKRDCNIRKIDVYGTMLKEYRDIILWGNGMKTFNTTGICNPDKNYMVKLDSRVALISEMVDDGKYFVINRARQYGKSTTLSALFRSIKDKYVVISIDFQGIGNKAFSQEELFVIELCRLIKREIFAGLEAPSDIVEKFDDIISRKRYRAGLGELFDVFISWMLKISKDFVLIIDEVDSATNNQVFLDFLSQLRDGYISRESKGTKAFKSVILAGVSDIKHLRSKIRDEEQHKVNSPWNIAADFNIDMSFSVSDILGMLQEYECDHQTGMDLKYISQQIYDYTSGYPFLVSRICQIMDEKMNEGIFDNKSDIWTERGLIEAVKILLSEKNTLFESLTGKLINYPELKEAVRHILIKGENLTYNPYQESIFQMEMYGFIRNKNNTVAVSNRIFETVLYNLFLSDEELQRSIFSVQGSYDKNMFISDGVINMQLVLERFIDSYNDVFGPLVEKFKEKDGRELFLLYIKPIINGTGNYYIEAQTRDQRRMDIVIDYLGKRYVVELKIWHGKQYNENGEEQLSGYLDSLKLKVGYMLTFNFNKKKEQGVKRINYKDKVIIEGII